MIVYVFTHSFSCLPLKFIPPPPFIVYTPALSEIWACDQGRNPGFSQMFYTRTFGGNIVRRFSLWPNFSPSNLTNTEKKILSVVVM